jgi:hypothetical protein
VPRPETLQKTEPCSATEAHTVAVDGSDGHRIPVHRYTNTGSPIYSWDHNRFMAAIVTRTQPWLAA